jgi:hypothetical protein
MVVLAMQGLRATPSDNLQRPPAEPLDGESALQHEPKRVKNR